MKPTREEREPAARRPSVRALAAGSVGNFVEWYEFGVYGYFATVIAERFFTPSGGVTAEGLVKTYASIAPSFFFRPVGAAPFGPLGDPIRRRPVMLTGRVRWWCGRLRCSTSSRTAALRRPRRGAAACAAGGVVGLMAGPGLALPAEIFPTRVRCTGLGRANTMSNAVFSGCAGLIITEAVKRNGNVDVPAYYAAAACAVSALALLTNPVGKAGWTDAGDRPDVRDLVRRRGRGSGRAAPRR